MRGSVKRRSSQSLVGALTLVIVLLGVAYAQRETRPPKELTLEEHERRVIGDQRPLRPSVTPVEDGLRVSWESVPGACRYKLGRLRVDNREARTVEVQGTEFVDAEITLRRTYSYTVEPISCDGQPVRGVFIQSASGRLPPED